MTLRGVVAAIGTLVVVVVCIRLGIWQLDRLEERRAQNQVVAQAMLEEAVPLARLEPRLRQDPDALRYRTVSMVGRYDGPSVIVRARSRENRPGVHLVTPFTADDGARILVLRGWVPAADGARPDTLVRAPAGRQEVSGILVPVPRGDHDARPVDLATGGETTWSVRLLDEATVRARFGDDLLPALLQLRSPAPDGLPHLVDPPEIEEGPHLSYAIQWFSFALIFLVGFIVVALRGPGGPRGPSSGPPQEERGVRSPEAEGVVHHHLD